MKKQNSKSVKAAEKALNYLLMPISDFENSLEVIKVELGIDGKWKRIHFVTLDYQWIHVMHRNSNNSISIAWNYGN